MALSIHSYKKEKLYDPYRISHKKLTKRNLEKLVIQSKFRNLKKKEFVLLLLFYKSFHLCYALKCLLLGNMIKKPLIVRIYVFSLLKYGLILTMFDNFF